MSESTEKPAWTPPPFGSPCWIEIPAVDVPSCKVVLSSPFHSTSLSIPFPLRQIDRLLIFPLQQKFYSSVFPTWEWRPASADTPEEKIALYSFAGNSGTFTSLMVLFGEDEINTNSNTRGRFGWWHCAICSRM
jgi:hypothetical protein